MDRALALPSPTKLTSSASFSPSIRISLRLKIHQAQAKNFCRVLDIRVAKRMEMHAFQPTVPGVFLHTVLQRPGFHIRIRAGKNIGRRTAGVHFPAELGHVSRHGNRSYGGIALWRADHNPGACGSGLIGVPQSLQCGGDPNRLFPQGYAAPLKCAQFPNPNAGE